MKKTRWIFGIVFLVMLAVASAETNIFSTSMTLSNDSSCGECYRQQQFIQYSENRYNSVKDEAMAFYISYSCESLDGFNSRNAEVTQIDHVEFYISQLVKETSDWVNYTMNVTDIAPFSDFKKFLYMNNGDSVIIKMDTYFEDGENVVSDSLCSFESVLGTRGCKKCRELNYYKFEQSVNERDIIDNYSDNILDKIYQLLFLNFEFFVIVYWIGMIGAFIAVIGLIFWGIFFLFHFIKHFFQKVSGK